ncbi:MAG: serine protease AprX, partial [Actinomycetota bacterium]|nr:serine protease AprX [Actinomycetota bacterium]
GVGTLAKTAKAVRATDAYDRGVTGAGVGVALIDSGVVPVPGLVSSGKVVNGPDLSFDSQADNLRYLDGYGHGTHIAGIIAGHSDDGSFNGIAPGATVLNVKVANASGQVDVSQVLAAIDWVVQHRNDRGMNVRVLNLSFGTDSRQPYTIDPLDYAAEVAWRNGIVVVAAAGNGGVSPIGLNDPADDPYVIAVGADDTNGTPGFGDDAVPAFSSRGDGVRNPDVVAPGVSIESLRDPNSVLDLAHPGAVVGTQLFKGTGTSQAAAVVSGAAALLLQNRPTLTPDQVKCLLTSTAHRIPGVLPTAQGFGVIDVAAALSAPVPPTCTQTFPFATGTGSLEAARGSVHVVSPDGTPLVGEVDIFGNSWSGNSWSSNSWSGVSWSGGMWNGNSWSGNSWSGNSWSGVSWSGVSWSGNSWSGNSWSSNSWSSNSWSGNSWSGNSWSGNSWSGVSWSGNSWSGNSWSSNSWSGSDWS